MKAIGYIRYSSEGQSDGSSIERQTEIIQEYVKRMGLELVETFIDESFSASKGIHLSHGKLGKVILPRVDAGEYRGFALVVEKADRFSRLGIARDLSLLSRLIEGGVELHFASSGRVARSLDDLGSVIMGVVDSHAAKQYTDNLKANIKKGKSERKDRVERGENWILSRNVPSWLEVVGRVNVGNKIIDPGTIQVIPSEVALVQEIFEMAAVGIGIQTIFNKLNGRLGGKSLTWLQRTLAGREVLGEFKMEGRDPITGYYPQIIPQSLYDAARQQATRKRKNGNVVSGNAMNSDKGLNLFPGLLWDVTDSPPRKLHAQNVQRARYLMSAKVDDRPSRRMRYERLEFAVLAMLDSEDWQKVAGNSETEEFKLAKEELEAVLRELDKANKRMESLQAAMDEETEVAVIRTIAAQLTKTESVIATLSEKQEALAANVDSVKAKYQALYSPEVLRDLIKQNSPEATAIRLRLRTEIAKRVERLDIKFLPNGFSCRINYVNGATSFEIQVAGDKYVTAEEYDKIMSGFAA